MNKEAAFIIGLLIGGVMAAVEQLSGPGIIVDGQPAQTAVNVLQIVLPIIGGILTRYQVYSKQTVAELTGTTPDTIPVSPP